MQKRQKNWMKHFRKKVIMIIMTLMVMLLSLGNLYKFVYTNLPSIRENVSFLIVGSLPLLAMFSLIYLTYTLMRQMFEPIKYMTHAEDIGSLDLQVNPNRRGGTNSLVSEANEMLAKLKYLITFIEKLNSNQSFQETVNYIYHSFYEFIPYNYIGIAIIEENDIVRAYHGVSDEHINGLPDHLIGMRTKLSDTTLGQVAASNEARIINDLEEYALHRPSRDYNELLIKSGVKASITLPLRVNGQPMGFIFFSSHEKNIYTKEHASFLKTLANSISLSFEKNKFTEDLVYTNILALAKLAEARDDTTGNHLNRMKSYSRLVAELLSKEGVFGDAIGFDFIEDIEKYSPLHDIGKVGIRDGILLKPGKLTQEEFDMMKKHTLYGAKVLREAEANIMRRGRSIFKMGIEITENHHEKWDGSGYPKGKKGEEIPLSARIVTVADVFDALASERPYKRAFSFEESLRILKEGKGSHFDPRIIDVIEKHQGELYRLYQELKEV